MTNESITEQLTDILDTQTVEVEPEPIPEPKLVEIIDYESLVSKNCEMPKLKAADLCGSTVTAMRESLDSDTMLVKNIATGETKTLNLAGKIRFCTRNTRK